MYQPDELRSALAKPEVPKGQREERSRRDDARTLVAALVAQLAAWLIAALLPLVVRGSPTSGDACAAPAIILPVAVVVAGLVVGALVRGAWWLTLAAGVVAGVLAFLPMAASSPADAPLDVIVGGLSGGILWLAFFATPFLYARYGLRRGPLVGIALAIPVVFLEVILWFVIVGLVVGLLLEC